MRENVNREGGRTKERMREIVDREGGRTEERKGVGCDEQTDPQRETGN